MVDTITITDNLPSDNELFKQIMLTNAVVWEHKISKKDIDTWLSNFTGEVFAIEYERNLALWLLANFVYYNAEEVRHLCKLLYKDYLHQMLWDLYLSNKIDIEIETAIKEIRKQSKFYHLGKPGESGAFILYFFRQENNLPISDFISNIKHLESQTKIIVFVDDVTITGDQAKKYIDRESNNIDKNKIKVLLTFISTDDAKKILIENDIKIISCIELDKRSKCFSLESYIFHHYKKHMENCKKFAEHYGNKAFPKGPLGYKKGEYTFGFFYNIPDNTLPIFWSEYNNWKPIFKRYDKKYLKTVYDELGIFV